MAPEMVLGDGPVDGRADLYSLACTAYWALTGQLLFQANTPAQMLLHHVQTRPVPPSRVSELPIPSELEAILMTCLEKDPCKATALGPRARVGADRCTVWRDVDNEAGAGMVGSAFTRQRAVKCSLGTLDPDATEPAATPTCPSAPAG